MSRLKGIAELFTPRPHRRASTHRRKPARRPDSGMRALEQLESRAMLAVSYAYDNATETLAVNMTGSDNSAVVEFAVLSQNIGGVSTNVLAARLSAPLLTELVLFPVSSIVVNVADPAVSTNNRVSFGIVPFDSAFDLSSFVFEGNGASGSGHFTCQTTALKATCSLNIVNIDAVSFTQADEIRIDGTFSNDTGDAEVGVVWQSLDPGATEVIIGTNRPLVADTIRVESAKSITFFNPVTATSDLTLRSNSPLDIDYDLKAGGTLVLDGTDGVTQRASATIVAPSLKVVSRAGTTTTGIVSLESDLNDFDTVQISSDTSGQISIRDVDDLVVSESGVTADAGRVVLDVRGPLTIASTIRALGLNAQSGASVLATPAASMTLGEDGLQIYASDSFDDLASGDVTLQAPIHIQAADATKLVFNRIRSAGVTLISGGLYVPSAGITTIEADGQVVVAGPIQAGSTKLDANSTTATVFDHDLTLVSHSDGITVNDVPGNDAVPTAIQATNIISFDAAATIDIRGAVFAGSRAGDATSRTASEALPAITIVGDADVVIAATGSLQTQAYENDAATFANPLLGRISIDAEAQFDLQGAILADGPVDVSSTGDVYLYGPLTARESIAVETSWGSIDVQASVRTTGWTYTSDPPAPLVVQRLPSILLAAPGGGISTSGMGTLSAGVMTTGAGAAIATVAGDVELQAQQDILLAANVVTAGGFSAGSQIGAFSLDALLQTGADGMAVISAATGVSESEFGRIVASRLDVTNTTENDIQLLAADNRIVTLTARNLAEGGINVRNNAPLTIATVAALGDVSITGSDTVTVRDSVTSAVGAVGVTSTGGGIVLRGSVTAADEISGGVRLTAHGPITELTGGVTTVSLVSGGSGYGSATTITIAAPASGGVAATARAIVGVVNGIAGVITGIEILSAGRGYAAGEQPTVTIAGGGSGALALATAQLSAAITGGAGVEITAGDDVTLLNRLTASTGDLVVASSRGSLDLSADTFRAHAAAGGVTLASSAGTVAVQQVTAQDDVTITGLRGVSVEDEIRSETGSVVMTADAGPATVRDVYALEGVSLTTARDIRVLGLVQAAEDLIRLESTSGLIEMVGDSKLHAKAGGIEIDAQGGSVELQRLSGFKNVTVNAAEAIDVLRSVVSRGGSIEIVSTNNAVNVRQLNAKQDVTVSGFKTSALAGEIVATKGDVNATSSAGGLRLNANIVAGDDITLEAQTFLEQLNRTGIEALQIISEGVDRQVTATPVPPTVTVTVAAPAAAGGRAATARAILGRRSLGNDPVGTPIFEYFIDRFEIIDAGLGYAIGEIPIVTTTGMPGAVVRGIGPTNLRNITARNNLTIHAEDDMTLLYRLTANKGDLSISSVSGDIDLGSKLLRLTVPGAKGDVSITTETGSIILPPVINIAGDITLRSFAPLTIDQQLTTRGGDVRLASTAGSLAVNANVFAADRIELSSKLGIAQNNGFMKAAELKATNMNAAGITLGSQGNDVDRFSATNVGDVTYTDADDFRVGLQTSGTMGVEVTGNVVSLSSVAPDSIIRVVAGMNYRRLNIAAGTLGGDDVGMVEFVVTSPLDNTSTAFSGRLRDMITYVSDNRANYVDDGATLPQPMTVVFDESGYVISEIQVASSLPAFRRPVLFDGGRVADSVASGRLGIRGSATAPTGITLAAGSGGSTIRETALYGFSKGSAAVLESPRNTVIDTYFGIQADGVTTSANLVGLNLSGSLSRLNTIGSKTFDAETVNKFAANTDAGILIQQGAFGNLVVGNEIGIAGLAKNRDGVRVDGSNGNRIGSEEQVTPDLSPIFSNRITNNSRHGVSIVNTQATGVADTNRVQNNFVGDNAGHGVNVQTGTNVVIGGDTRFHANVFAKNAGSGVFLGGATSVNVVGNHIGVDSEATKAMGNGRMGVEVAVGSGSVRIENNRISANGTNGIGITSRTSGAVITGNVIGGLLEDGTAAGNKFDGVLILNANGNIVGKGNLISQNLRSGVSVTSADAATLAEGNRVFGSEIIHNEQHGVRITGSNRVTVGGATEDLANLIYGNKQDGVRIERHPTARTPATGNVIVNNFIGTNEFADVAAGTENTGFDIAPIFNNGFGYPVPLGNASGIVIVQGNANQVRGNTIMNNKNGIEVLGGNGNVIGGATETFANTISHNTGDGILIADRTTAGGPTPVATSNVTVSGNSITSNGGDGIEVIGSKVAVVTIGQNVTGQTVTGLPNTIQENAGNAVVVDGGQRVSLNGNAIAGEILVQNGANAGSAAPMALGSTIDVVRRSNSQLVIKGTITGPSTARYERYLIDVFHKDPFDPSAMRTFLGRQTVVTDENGRATFEFTINASIQVGDEICLTATSLVYQPGATSMLGDCIVQSLPSESPSSGTQGPRPPTRVPNR